jgi:DNA-binding SARP family transcriptional activator/tetratricopeptide (TPR) repeat protein
MRFEVLGPLRVRCGDEVVTVSGTLRRSLLAVLLARANEPVPVDVLLDALWGEEAGDSGVQRLRVHVHRLRATLDDPERLSFGPDGYCLHLVPDDLDACRFDALLDEASGVVAVDPRRCAELVRQALDLWRGTPYQGVDVPDLIGEVQRLAERRLVAVEDLYTAELRLGRHGEVTGELTELVHRHPLRERLHGLLMTALYQGGRQADALAVYRDARDVLADELGLDPGPELRALENQILQGEPIELAAPAPIAFVPAQIPHDIAGFVGRDGELSQLDALLSECMGRVPIAAVVGTAGVGKTAMTVRWAHRVKDRFPDGQLYIDLRGYGPGNPVPPEDALAAFLRALGVGGAAIPQDPTERAAQFRTVVDRKKLLILLDNARSAVQVRPLLPGSSSCLVVITSRDALGGLVAREGAHRVRLGRMPIGEAHRLLTELLGDRGDTESETTAQLIERCARLPLALRIAAERIREHPHHLAALVAELADEHARLDLLDSGDDPDASVRAVFFSSYRNLDSEAARLFRLFGVHPGHDIDAHALTALAGGDDLRTTRRLLDTLTRASLVDETADRRYVLHDLLATYAAELTETTDPPAERTAALARLLDYYLHAAARAVRFVMPSELEPSDTVGSPVTATPELSTYEAAIRWLNNERANLVRAAEAATRDLPGYTTNLSRVLSGYLDLGMHLDEVRRLQTISLDIAREHGDLVAEGIALRSFGLMHLYAHQFDEAERYFEKSLALHEKAGARVFQATTLNHLGALCGFAGRVEDGIRHLRRSAELFQELGHRLMAQRPLTSLGQLHLRQGRHESALHYLHQAFTITVEYDYPPGQFQTSYGLAGVYRDLGRYADALDCVHRALNIARSSHFSLHEVATLYRLGTIHLRLGDHEKAKRHHHQALAIARNIYNTQLIAMTLNGLAETHAAAGAPADVIRGHHLDALMAATNLGARYEQARAHAGLGDLHQRQGEHGKAIEHWQRALTTYRDLRAPKTTELQEKIDGAQGRTAQSRSSTS